MLLACKSILIAEDEPLIALDLESAVLDQQGKVIGPVATAAEALLLAEAKCFDGAILDLMLREELALSVAECLFRRSIPFVVHSGRTITIPKAWPTVPFISKPASPEQVVALLAVLIRK